MGNTKEADEEELVVSTKEITKICWIWEDFEEDANVIDVHGKNSATKIKC